MVRRILRLHRAWAWRGSVRPPTFAGAAVALAVVAAALATAPSPVIGVGDPPDVARPDSGSGTAVLPKAIAAMPMSFVANRGQVDGRVRYYVQGPSTSLFFTRQGVTYSLRAKDPSAGRYGLDESFVGASRARRVTAEDPHAGTVNYFAGPRSSWQTGIRSYGAVRYLGVWPGIDVVFTGSGSTLKYEYLVHPGADPSDVAMAYRGATTVHITPDGTLAVATPVRTLTDARPSAYQTLAGRRVPVRSAFRRLANAHGDPAIGFDVGRYDHHRTLVIDPAVLVYGGYIGGAGEDKLFRVVADDQGNTYVTGFAESDEATFPVTVGPDLTFNGGLQDPFVAKINAAGTGFDYVGYIGGGGSVETGLSIDIDATGAAYVSGTTSSDQTTFPVTIGPDLTYGGASDMFVAKVSPDGTSLVFCGYVGGDQFDEGMRIAIGDDGSVYVGGYTASTEATVPVTVGPDLTYNGGQYDGLVAKIAPDGSHFDYLGYIGGDDMDMVRGLAVDAAGDAYVTGLAHSTQATFPVKGGPDLTFNGGVDDTFVAEVSPDGASLIYSGYVGGDGLDEGRWLVLGPDGSVYITGNTQSHETSFPVKVGPDLTYNGGFIDAFVAKVLPGGTGLAYAGYVGGRGNDEGRSLALASDGSLYVVGETTSNEASFPVKGGPDLTYAGSSDAYLLRITPDGSGEIFGTYIGGVSTELGSGVFVGPMGEAYVGGQTASDETTFPVLVGPDLTYNGAGDGFVAKLVMSPGAVFTTAPAPYTNETRAKFVFGPDDPSATMTCAVDGNAPHPCTGRVVIPSVTEGTHTLSVALVDGWGNLGATDYTWTVDTVAPTVTFDSGPADPTRSTTASFTWTASETGSTSECSRDGAPFTSCVTGITIRNLAEGPHTFAVRATDMAGNTGPEAAWSWTVDRTPPTVTFLSGPPATTSETTATFTFTADEPVASFRCVRDSTVSRVCVSGVTISNLSVGPHTFDVRAEDMAGNRGPFVEWQWTVTPLRTRLAGPARRA